MDILSPIDRIKGIGEKNQLLLNRLGIVTILDLIEYYPRNYDVYKPAISPEEAKVGELAAIVVPVVTTPKLVRTQRLQLVTLKAGHGAHRVTITWYHMPYLKNSIKTGTTYVFRGILQKKKGILSMEHPEIFTTEEYAAKCQSLVPIYALTKGVTNNFITKMMHQVLKSVDLSREVLTQQMRKRYRLSEYNFAIRTIHFPPDWQTMLMARKRLVFEEFYLFALAIRSMKNERETYENYFCVQAPDACREFVDKLPYTLTDGQGEVWREIQRDMASERVMNRLVQGDVGSGKTVVALLALMNAALNGYQGCIMAPTEVLARQHMKSFQLMLRDYPVRLCLLTGSMTAKEKRNAYGAIENHQVDIIIGTHALIQDNVNYARLALVVTDEQHRFGVRQREFLSEKGDMPHVLVMSATPIPRTLAMILYGDLDISVIRELPAQRLPIKNCVVGTDYRPNAYRFIEKEIRQGHQAYIICPMVEESEFMDAENVLDYTKKVREAISADIVVEYLHGKQKPKEKNVIMERFARNEIQVLISTTVVEVGVNVPNATVIMIENAERFGLAQLHQLRGRVGRSEAQSYCIFLQTSNSDTAKERLEVLVKSNDGFYIAEEDLKLRGPGDLFGLRQSGLMEFKIGDLFNDMDVLKEAFCAAGELYQTPQLLETEDYLPLKMKIQNYMNHAMNSLIL